MIPSVLAIAFMANARDVETRIHKFLGSSQSMKEMEGSLDEVHQPTKTPRMTLKNEWRNKDLQKANAERLANEKHIYTAKATFKNADHNLVKEWLGPLIDRNGIAPHSVCNLQGSDPHFCPTGFSASCKEESKKCVAKWPDARDWVIKNTAILNDDKDSRDPCEDLPHPYPNKVVEDGTEPSENELVHATTAYCHEHWCRYKSQGKAGAPVCQKATKKDRDERPKLGTYKDMSGDSKEYEQLVEAHMAEGKKIRDKKLTGTKTLNDGRYKEV